MSIILAENLQKIMKARIFCLFFLALQLQVNSGFCYHISLILPISPIATSFFYLDSQVKVSSQVLCVLKIIVAYWLKVADLGRSEDCRGNQNNFAIVLSWLQPFGTVYTEWRRLDSHLSACYLLAVLWKHVSMLEMKCNC